MDKTNNTNKVILITSSSRGIGKAIAKEAHQEGYQVIVHGKTDLEDPLNILSSSKGVVENSQFVFIKPENIPNLISRIKNHMNTKGLDSSEQHFGATRGFEDNVQLVFVEDVVNFCFWAEKGQDRWLVEFPKGEFTKGGWYGLKTCFERALAKDIPILDAQYLSTISLEDVKHLFRSANEFEIPLVKERQNNLQEAGQILIDKFDGHFVNVLNQSNFDAVELAKLVYQNFPSFRDISILDGQEVRFLKRAQICAFDISYLFKKDDSKQFKNLEQLTAFADYKLPQVLRMFDVIKYTQELTDKIDNYIEIPHDSREEIEIRAATIWAIELIHQQASDLSVAQIDNVLWLISQDKNLQQKSKPYHRTRTIYY